MGTFGATDATVLVDPDATTADAEVSLPGPYAADGTIAWLRHDTMISLAFDMISTRLNDDISRGLAPFTDASVSNNGVVRRLDAPSVSVSGEPAQLAASLQAVTSEFERVRRYGFDDTELERVLRGYRSSLQAQFDASDTVQDIEYISGYVDHFLSGLSIPDADTTFQIFNSIYDDITADAVGAAFNELLGAAGDACSRRCARLARRCAHSRRRDCRGRRPARRRHRPTRRRCRGRHRVDDRGRIRSPKCRRSNSKATTRSLRRRC